MSKSFEGQKVIMSNMGVAVSSCASMVIIAMQSLPRHQHVSVYCEFD